MFLYRPALEEGVRLTFNAPVRTREDFDRLPPGPSWPSAPSETPSRP